MSFFAKKKKKNNYDIYNYIQIAPTEKYLRWKSQTQKVFTTIYNRNFFFKLFAGILFKQNKKNWQQKLAPQLIYESSLFFYRLNDAYCTESACLCGAITPDGSSVAFGSITGQVGLITLHIVKKGMSF